MSIVAVAVGATFEKAQRPRHAADSRLEVPPPF